MYGGVGGILTILLKKNRERKSKIFTIFKAQQLKQCEMFYANQ